MSDWRFLHQMAVYFGVADETVEDRRARLDAPHPPLPSLLVWCMLSGTLIGGVFYGLLVGSALRGAIYGLALGAALFALRLHARRRTRRERGVDERGD